MKFFIVIPVYNRLALTRKCLSSLAKQSYRNFKVILVDDGSTDGTTQEVNNEFSMKFDLVILQGNGKLWWAGGIKKGVELALQEASDEDCIVTLNNDVTFDFDLLMKAKEVLCRNPGAMVGGISVDSEDKITIAKTGWKMICWPFAKTRRVWWPNTLSGLCSQPTEIDVDFIPGTSTFTPVQIVRKVGTVDSIKLPHYHADSEYSFRIKRMGFPVILSREIVLFHNLTSTGVLSNVKGHSSIRQIITSFYNIRSGNCLKYKFHFARACCPGWALFPYLIFDTIKVLIWSIGILLLGKNIENIRSKIN